MHSVLDATSGKTHFDSEKTNFEGNSRAGLCATAPMPHEFCNICNRRKNNVVCDPGSEAVRIRREMELRSGLPRQRVA
jgi:hypothetical protein